MSTECIQNPQQTHKRECLFKIIVIGDMSTGKTSLIQRYVRGVINQHYKPTLGVDFATKLIQFDDTLVRIQFWDISGQERFANMTRVYYRDSHGAIIVYDCKRSETYKGAFRWKKDLDSKLMLENGNPIPSILVANKMPAPTEYCASTTPLLISAALGIFLLLFLVIYTTIFRSDIAYYFKGKRDRKRRRHRGGGTETTVGSTVGSTYNATTATTYNPPPKAKKHRKRGRR